MVANLETILIYSKTYEEHLRNLQRYTVAFEEDEALQED